MMACSRSVPRAWPASPQGDPSSRSHSATTRTAGRPIEIDLVDAVALHMERLADSAEYRAINPCGNRTLRRGWTSSRALRPPAGPKRVEQVRHPAVHSRYLWVRKHAATALLPAVTVFLQRPDRPTERQRCLAASIVRPSACIRSAATYSGLSAPGEERRGLTGIAVSLSVVLAVSLVLDRAVQPRSPCDEAGRACSCIS